MTSILNESQNGRQTNGGGWRMAALSAFATVLFAVVGWIATEASTARAKMADELTAANARIAVLEESNRNIRESLARIERGVDDLREQLRQAQERRR